MNILQQPDALSFSMNLKKFIVSATGTISFILRLGERELISHKYEPGTDGMVEIDVRDIVHPQLSYIIKDSGEVYRQSNLTADFTAIINTTEIVFRVVRGGVDQLADSAANFLTQNFLTWQPSVKPVTYYSPEFLTYYAVGTGKIKLRAYFTDDEGNVTTEQEHAIVDIIPGIAYTIPLQYSVVAGWLGNKLPAYYDVWAESTAGHRFTYIQRYYAENMRPAREQWVLFENSLGELDTFRAYGSDQFNAEHTHNLAETDEVSQEYRVDTERKHQKNTGYLNKEEARWLLDFFPSQKKYLYTGSYLRQIVVMESNVTGKLQEAPLSYTFTYKYADARPLLNLPRTDVPADVLNITIPEVGSFTVPPRLAEVPRLPLSEGALFPVQNPYSENWGTTTVGMIGNFISKIFASYKFFKGYFSIPQFLILKYPDPQEGWYAFVGTPWPGKVYECRTAGTWVDTGVSPTVGDDIFVELLKRYIDGTTIYWDVANRVIKARGGGDNVFSIVVSIETVDIGRVSVTASGDSVGVTPSADGDTYTVTGTVGGTVTVSIVAEEGYQVQKLDVDDVPQGNISEYTFERLDRDHTMKVWMEVSDETPTDFLVRSDLPDVYYSSTQDAFNAVKTDYPDGLTRDVTITCVKPAREKRVSGVFLAALNDFNNQGMHSLTIDGTDKLVYDARSLGGLRLVGTDNVIIKNVEFINYANKVDETSPDEIEAVQFKGSKSMPSNNLHIHNCRFNGTATSDPAKVATLTIGIKDSKNIYISNCGMDGNNGITIDTKDVGCLSLVHNEIRMSKGTGHPSILAASQGTVVMLEDNDFSGEIGENAIQVNNTGYIHIRRNKFHDVSGQMVSISENVSTKEVIIEGNLFVNALIQPFYGWSKAYVTFGNIINLKIDNNTFYMNSGWFEQYALRGNSAEYVDSFNNIFINAAGSKIPVTFFTASYVKRYRSGSNIYQHYLKENGDVTMGVLFNISNPTGDPEYIAAVTSGGSLPYLQGRGFETDSILVDYTEKVIEVQNGSSSYAITPSYNRNTADDAYVPAIDLEYKVKAASGNSRGCLNLSGIAIDELSDGTTGYDGLDLEEETGFTDAAQYSSYADNRLLLKSKLLNRNRTVRMEMVGSLHRYLILGRYGIVAAEPVTDGNGEYVSDELYTVNIK